MSLYGSECEEKVLSSHFRELTRDLAAARAKGECLEEDLAREIRTKPWNAGFPVCLVEVELIDVGENRRKKFEGIEDLAKHIARVGLRHPIIVVRTRGPQGLRFQLKDGERRLRAVRDVLQMKQIPAFVYDSDLLYRDAYHSVRMAMLPLGMNLFQREYTKTEMPDVVGEYERLERELEGQGPQVKTRAQRANGLEKREEGGVRENILPNSSRGGSRGGGPKPQGKMAAVKAVAGASGKSVGAIKMAVCQGKKLKNLIPGLQALVDEGLLGQTLACTVGKLSRDRQRVLCRQIEAAAHSQGKRTVEVVDQQVYQCLLLPEAWRLFLDGNLTKTEAGQWARLSPESQRERVKERQKLLKARQRVGGLKGFERLVEAQEKRDYEKLWETDRAVPDAEREAVSVRLAEGLEQALGAAKCCLDRGFVPTARAFKVFYAFEGVMRDLVDNKALLGGFSQDLASGPAAGSNGRG
jgi:hypothetical protein